MQQRRGGGGGGGKARNKPLFPSSFSFALPSQTESLTAGPYLSLLPEQLLTSITDDYFLCGTLDTVDDFLSATRLFSTCRRLRLSGLASSAIASQKVHVHFF